MCEMKVYRVFGESNSSNFTDILIAKDETQAEEITQIRYGKLLKFKTSEMSIESVRISQLTLGDLDRFISKKIINVDRDYIE